MARFTIPTSAIDSASPGISRLAAALGGGGQAYQQGFDQAATTQSRIAQALAQVRNLQAEADAHDAMAAETKAKTGVLAGRPDLFNEQVAAAAGTDVPTVNAFRNQLRTGAPATVPMGPPTEEGAMGATPLSAEARTKIAAALQQFLPVLSNTGDLKPDDMAAAAKTFRDMGLSDAIINGTANRNAVAGAQAAVAAKPIYNTNTDGAVLDQYGGGLATDNPMARASIDLRGAQAGEASAKAGLARAQTNDVTSGPKGQFDPTLGVVVDTRSGVARPVIDATTGKPIGPKAGTGSLNQEQANALTFATRMQAADQILADLAQKGVTRPGTIKQVAGGVPFIGDSARDALAASTNWTQSGPQQQVEQAQRDFINAVLRRESGAAISNGEFDNARQQYFPQPGDAPAVIAQKAAARKRVIQGMLAAVPPNQRTLPELPGAATKTVTVDY